MNEPLARDLMRSLTADLPIGVAPVEVTIAGGRRLRRRRIFAGGVAAAVAAGAVVTSGLLLHNDDPPELISPATNPLSHAWWAEGTLHLSSGTVRVAGVRELVQIPGGVVVLTDQGEVRRVDDDGVSRVIGHWSSGAPREDLRPSVRAQDDGRVVWLDGTTTPDYSFVVYDLASGDRVASHSIPTGGFHEAAWLNEFEDGVVYWDAAAYGQRAWAIDTDKETEVGTGATFLAALENGLWVTYKKTGLGIEVAAAGDRLWSSTDNPGWFSPDGATLVTMSLPPLRLQARDSLTGREVASAIDLPMRPARVFLDDDDKLTYVVGAEGPEGIVAPYDLVSCDLESARCTTVVKGATQHPVLPAD
jgi:hypothetical protein